MMGIEGAAKSIARAQGKLRCEMIMACESADLAKRIACDIPAAIGFVEAQDLDLRVFVRWFYDVIAAGEDIPTAFDHAESIPQKRYPKTKTQPLLELRRGISDSELRFVPKLNQDVIRSVPRLAPQFLRDAAREVGRLAEWAHKWCYIRRAKDGATGGFGKLLREWSSSSRSCKDSCRAAGPHTWIVAGTH